MGQVRVVILNDQAFSLLLHLQMVQRSLRVEILRAMPVYMMCSVGHSASHVAARDVANFCGG